MQSILKSQSAGRLGADGRLRCGWMDYPRIPPCRTPDRDMTDRLYFLLGDLAACTVIGALAALAAAWLIGPHWPVLIALPVALALGLIVANVAAVPFMRSFGAMEVMVPTMLGGLLAAGSAGLWAAIAPLGSGTAALLGAGAGLAALATSSYADRRVKGAAAREGSRHGP